MSRGNGDIASRAGKCYATAVIVSHCLTRRRLLLVVMAGGAKKKRVIVAHNCGIMPRIWMRLLSASCWPRDDPPGYRCPHSGGNVAGSPTPPNQFATQVLFVLLGQRLRPLVGFHTTAMI